MKKQTRIALALGALFGLLIMSVDLVGASRSSVERTLEPEIPILTPDEGEPPLKTMSDNKIEELREGVPQSIASNGEKAAVTGTRLSSATVEMLAREVDRTEIIPDGPIFDGSGEVIGHNFELRFSDAQRLEISRQAYTDELHRQLPELGMQQLVLDGVTRLLVGIGKDGSVIDIVYVPVGDGGQRVTIEDVTPANQRLTVVTDKDGEPVLDEFDSITVRAGKDEVKVAKEQFAGEGH